MFPPRIVRVWRSGVLAGLFGLVIVSSARAEPTTVEIVNYFNVQGQLDGLAAIAKDFEAQNPDVKIKLTYVPFGELVQRSLQMAAVHKPPAIAAIDNPDVLRVAKAGILKDISAEVNKMPTWADTYPGPKKAVTDGEKVFGVPIGSNSLALFYNKQTLNAAGLNSPPGTWDELKDAATKLTKAPVYGLAYSAVNTEEATWQWEPFLWSNQGSLLDLTDAPAKRALEYWADFVRNKSVSRDAVNWNQGDVANQFISGQAAMMVMGPWMLGQVHKSGLDFGVVAIPVPKAGEKPVVPLGGEVWCVMKTDEKTENAAVKFIAFVQDPVRLEKLCDTFNYISAVKAVAAKQGQANPELQAFVLQMDSARARSQDGGANYPAISLAARSAIQKALTGQASVDAALSAAAETIKGLAKK